jgi:hypothetical protein
LMVQGLKGMEQSAVDVGSWRHAWPLTTLEELDKVRRWAGSEREMQTVVHYTSSIDKMRASVGAPAAKANARKPWEPQANGQQPQLTEEQKATREARTKRRTEARKLSATKKKEAAAAAAAGGVIPG